MSVEFWVTSIVLTATPGTGAIFTIAAGLSRGLRAAGIAAIGCTLGIVPHLALALTGAAAVLAASPIAFEAIKWLGVAYLLYIAWGSWHQTGALALPNSAPTDDAALPVRKVIGSAVLVNLLNPKLTLFFFVFLPSFVNQDAGNAVLQMAGLGLMIMSITLVIFSAYGAGAAWLRQYVVTRPEVMRWINRGFAVSFVVLAALLALTGP